MSLSDGITRQREEREVLERSFERAAELPGRVDDRVRLRDDLLERRVGEQPGDRQRQLGEHLRAVDDDDAAAAVREPAHRCRHRRVVHPDDDDVVRVVGDRRGDRAALQAEAAHEAEADAAGAEVALDDGDLREVAAPGRRAPRRRARGRRRPASR